MTTPEPEVWARPATPAETLQGARVVARAAEAHGWTASVTYARGTYPWPKKGPAVVDSLLVRMAHPDGRRAAAHWLDGKFDDAYAWGPADQQRKVGVNNLKHLLALAEWPAVPAASEPTVPDRGVRPLIPRPPVVPGSWGTVHVGDVVRGADQRPWRVVERGPTLRWVLAGESADFTMHNADRGEVTARRKLSDPCDVMARDDHTATAAAVGALVAGGLDVEILRESDVELFRGVGCGEACGDGHAVRSIALECRAAEAARDDASVEPVGGWAMGEPATHIGVAARPCDDPFCGPGGCGWEPVQHVKPGATTPKERTRTVVTGDPFETPSASNVDPLKNGRYHLPDPITGEPTSYQRVTNLVKFVADTFGIERWEKRLVAKGVALRPDLVALGAALDLDEDKKALDGVAKQAKEFAKAKAGANMGTALHKFTDRIDRGESLESLGASGAVLNDLRAYVAVKKAARLTTVPEYMERIVVVPQLGVAGKLDRMDRMSDGRLTIEDLKTGKDLDYSWLEIAIQEACYANARYIWTGRPWPDAYEPMPTNLDRERGLVTWLPVGQKMAHVYGVDLIKGWEWAQLAVKVREARAEAGRGVSWLVAPTDQSTVALHLVSRAGSREELAELWESFNKRNLWSAEVDAAAQATFARLQQSTTV